MTERSMGGHEVRELTKHIPSYYKTWSKVCLALKLMLSLLLAKRVTVTETVLNQD
jgi:hypothetical protein